MLHLLVFLGGVFAGFVLTRLLMNRKSGTGSFKVRPYKDEDGIVDGLYTITVCLTPEQNLDKKSIIILRKDDSQK